MKYGCDLKLNSERVIHLNQLFQYPSYSGLFLGLPSGNRRTYCAFFANLVSAS